MRPLTPSSHSTFGHRVFGIASLSLGLITLIWHDYSDWHPARLFVYAAAVALIVGGAALQVSRTAKLGALVLAAAYTVYTLLCLPGIVSAPRIYNSWGNFFEQFSLLAGAATSYAWLSPAWPPKKVKAIGRISLGVCAASFALEQAIYIQATAGLVPKWVPPSQMFWAIATTGFFGLAAAALLTNRMAALASRLMTIMIVSFGVLVWVPLVVAGPHSHGNWSEMAETFAIAVSMWILADLLGEDRLGVRSAR